MAEPSPITERELRFLRELVRGTVPFMIVDLSAAALQGAPAVTEDIDLWFRDLAHPGLREALLRVGGAYVPPSVLNPPMFAGADLELFDIVLRMDGPRATPPGGPDPGDLARRRPIDRRRPDTLSDLPSGLLAGGGDPAPAPVTIRPDRRRYVVKK